MLKLSPNQLLPAQRKLMLHLVVLQRQHQAQCLSRRLLHRVHRHHAQGNLMFPPEVSLGAGIVTAMGHTAMGHTAMCHAASGAILRAKPLDLLGTLG